MRVGLLKQNYDKNTKINVLKTDTPLNKKTPQNTTTQNFTELKKVRGLSIFLFLNLLHFRNGA